MQKVLQNKTILGFGFWLWTAIIIAFSLIPKTPDLDLRLSEEFNLRMDYILHFLVFFAFSTLFILWKFNKKVKPLLILIFLFVGLVFGASTELVQSLIPGRSFNIYDLYSNNLGLLCGSIIPVQIIRRRQT